MAVDQLSATFSALADPTRRAILARLASGDCSVTELAEPFDMSMPAVSKHLRVLERAAWLREGAKPSGAPAGLTRALSSTSPTGPIGTARSGNRASTVSIDYLQELKRRRRNMAVSSVANSDTFKASTPSDREVVLTRLFDAPRRLVFDAMTKPEHVKRWWGCLGERHSVPVCEIDLRGGRRLAVRRPQSEGRRHVLRRLSRDRGPGVVFTEIFAPLPDVDRWSHRSSPRKAARHA